MEKENPPKWVKIADKLNNYLTIDLLGGPGIIKMAWIINLHKGLTFYLS